MQTIFKQYVLGLLAAVMVSGCATIPSGPSVMVLPAAGKTFEDFQADDAICRQWAGQQVGMPPDQAANQSLAKGAAVGTAAGAVVGAALGSISGNAGSGAAIGAGTGLIGGAAVGSQTAYASAWEIQRRYDIAYQQCMYAKGNLLPGVAQRGGASAKAAPPPPPPPPPPP